MHVRFNDPNAFDEFARNHGGWCYDNGWCYNDESFGCSYIGIGNENPENLNYFRMLRHDATGRTVVLHLEQQHVTEIWSGIIHSPEDFNVMTNAITEYTSRIAATMKVASTHK